MQLVIEVTFARDTFHNFTFKIEFESHLSKRKDKLVPPVSKEATIGELFSLESFKVPSSSNIRAYSLKSASNDRPLKATITCLKRRDKKKCTSHDVVQGLPFSFLHKTLEG